VSGDDYRRRIGRRIREARLAKEWSQTQLAQRLGVADKQVSRWENGQMPYPQTLERIAAELGVTAEWFLRDDG
jgi:transcriptional regulator with XRE-family HTH domain